MSHFLPMLLPLVLIGAAGPGKTEPVSARYAGVKANRPPLMTRFFDVTLRNEAAEPRWFIFPASLTEERKKDGGVDTVELWKYPGEGTVLLGDFLGTGGFKAVLLPAHAEVSIKRLPIQSSEETPLQGKTTLPVLIASSLTLGGQPAEAWMGGKAASDAKASVDADQASRAGQKMTPGLKELPVAWTETGRSAPVVEITGN